MERRAPRACLALLWGCLLGAAAAQGKEGERARRGRPGPPAPRAPGSWRASTHAPSETDLAPPSPACWGRDGARAAIGANLGPPPGALGFTGTGEGGLGARGSEPAEKGRSAGHAVAAPAAASGTRSGGGAVVPGGAG